MRILLDTTILVRFNISGGVARQAVRNHAQLGATFAVTPQILTEYWAVATRPPTSNGLGLDPNLVSSEIDNFQNQFVLLHDTPECFAAWHRLAKRHSVIGKQAHDAKIVGAMLAHGVAAILTLNPGDFARYGEIQVLTP